MKVGQVVNYHNPERVDATIVEIDGVGPSTAKTLKLLYNHKGANRVVEEVPHAGDAEEGAPYWTLKGTEEIENAENSSAFESAEGETPAPAPKRALSRRRRSVK